MGYTTSFDGDWTVQPALKPEHKAYLTQFAQIRHMKRDADKAALLPDPLRLAVGLPIGYEGAYYVGTAGTLASQNKDASVLDGNSPPGCPDVPPTNPANPLQDFGSRYLAEQELRRSALAIGICVPGLWCQWVPNETGSAIEWDGGEKFYEYVEWIEYLVAHFFAPWGYKLNGNVYWEGEEQGDMGRIEIVDNVITVKHAVITYQ